MLLESVQRQLGLVVNVHLHGILKQKETLLSKLMLINFLQISKEFKIIFRDPGLQYPHKNTVTFTIQQIATMNVTTKIIAIVV
jgi:hypothetical protein